jgi:hypothetical protein
MDVGLIYSSKDPSQKKTRDFVKKFIEEHGLLVKYTEADKDVDSPRIIINGQLLVDQRQKKGTDKKSIFPDLKSIAKQLEHSSWCL